MFFFPLREGFRRALNYCKHYYYLCMYVRDARMDFMHAFILFMAILSEIQGNTVWSTEYGLYPSIHPLPSPLLLSPLLVSARLA